MKYILALLISFGMCFHVTAQVTSSSGAAKPGFATGLDIFTDFWMNLPKGIESRTINQGMNFYLAYNNPIGSSAFATSIGISLGAHNLYSNAFLQDDTSGSFFVPIAGPLGQEVKYKRSKLTLAYMDLPLEITMKTKSGVFASAGVKAGFLLNAHTKYKGNDPLDSSNKVKIKEGELSNIESYRLAAIMRLGYKWVNVYGAYSFTNVFQEGMGPEIYPISVGLSLRPR